VQTRPIDISFSFAVPSLMFIRLPRWYNVMRFGSPEEIIAAFTDPDSRAKLIADATSMMGLWSFLRLRQVASAANQPLVGKTLAEIAQLRGVTPLEAMIDLSIEEKLDAHFLAEGLGHNMDADIGASDGGAHILSFSTYGDTGYLFGHFVRDVGSMTVEEAVKKITADTAAIWGIPDRGQLQAGLVADIVVFDAAAIDRGAEVFVQDVPGDGSRYVRDARGVDTVIVGGAVAWSAADGYGADPRGVIVPGPVALAAERAAA
jgi:N-acyl-D-aspartate/D-glutamate deacylase